MSPVRAYYYDGKSSARRIVSLERIGENLRLLGDGVDVNYPVASVRVSSPVGRVRRSLRFPNGVLCEIIDDAPLGELLGNDGGLIQRLLARWERSIPLALLAMVLTVATIVLFIKYGLPAVARHVAYAVPASSEANLGRESLAFLDKYLMQPSKLPEARRREVMALFKRMRDNLPEAGGYRLEFRASDQIGANAFALPGGTIVVTDGMVGLAKRDDDLTGVLAHEAGHVRNRHALRHVLQSTGSGLLIAAVTGDITSITSLSATLPTALVNAGYSREFENEADDAAVAYLVKAGIEPKVYADMLARLQGEHDKRAGKKGDTRRWSPADLFASHPETSERIRRVLGRRK